MLRKYALLFFILTTSLFSSAQKAEIKGIIIDTVEHRQLEYSSVLLISKADSILIKSTRTDQYGKFELKNIAKGKYQLLVSYPKMADYLTELNVNDSSQINLGKINMDLKSLILNEVVIKAAKNAVRMRGDTLVFQADSFQLKPNANVQDLLKRLPGIEVDKNGNIKAEGKNVTTVLVDGDEFFGDDPLLATKYLKANAVEEIQVYDKKTKSADLTGIDDGKKDKTINIKLKENAKNGYLSTIDVKSNLANFYDYGGMAGIFKNKLKAAVYGGKSTLNLRSRVNQTLSKIKGDDYDMIEVGDDGSTVMYMSSDYDENDESGAQGNGLPNNFLFGAHFSNKWNANKESLKLNYKSFDNKNTNLETSSAEELLPNGTRFIGSGFGNTFNNNIGQNLRGYFEIKLDSISSLKISLGANKSRRNSSSISFNETHSDQALSISQNAQNDSVYGDGEAYNGNVNYTRKFRKKGRSLSIDLQPDTKNSSSDGVSFNTTNYYNASGTLSRIDTLNLKKLNIGSQQSIGTKINYAEPLGKRWIMEMGYSFKGINSDNNRQVFDNIKSTQNKVDSLSNNFNFNSFSHLAKVIIQYKVKKFSISSGLEATQTNLKLNDIDRVKAYDRNYLNLSPRTSINYKAGKNTMLQIYYNGSTRQPSLDQLQPVREINNPLYQVIGNPNLKPSFNNNININFNSYNFPKNNIFTAT